MICSLSNVADIVILILIERLNAVYRYFNQCLCTLGFGHMTLSFQAPREKQTLFVGYLDTGCRGQVARIFANQQSAKVGQFRKTKLCRFHETGAWWVGNGISMT